MTLEEIHFLTGSIIYLFPLKMEFDRLIYSVESTRDQPVMS